MFTIYLHDSSRTLRFRLVGELTGAWASELEQSWRTAASILKSKELIIDLTEVTSTDDEGDRILRDISQSGARFITASPQNDALAQRISGRTPASLPLLPLRNWRKLLCWLTRCCRSAQSSLSQRLPCAAAVRKIW
jgi:anti-anti-sigma regulatory factor